MATAKDASANWARQEGVGYRNDVVDCIDQDDIDRQHPVRLFILESNALFLFQFPRCQFNGFVSCIRRGLKIPGFKALGPKVEGVTMQVQSLNMAARPVEEC